MSGHIMLMPWQAWGHTKPAVAFGCMLAKQCPDVSVTLVTAGDYTPRVEREISRYFPDSRVKPNIRTVNLGGQGLDPLSLLPVCIAEFPAFYGKVLKGESIKCSATQKAFVLKTPSAVVLDFFIWDIFQVVRSVTGKRIPVYAIDILFSYGTLALFGPEGLGMFGKVEIKARVQAEATGRKMEDILNEEFHPHSGAVIKVAGLPPIYDYEFMAQEMPPQVDQAETHLWTTARRLYAECDGVITISDAKFERDSIAAFRGWLGETNRPLYVVGPLVPPGFNNSEVSDAVKRQEVDGSENGQEIMAFLDKSLKSQGKHSLIYVSFGTLWWPNNNEQVWLMVDILLELQIPFIMSLSSPFTIVPPGYHDKVKESGTGLLAAWTPQQTILSHPATGWHLSHCGQNSISEGLAQGIPIIAWPIRAEQAFSSLHMVVTLDVAFELVEVRTGNALRPLHRGPRPTGTMEAVAAEVRDVFKRARGPEGERKRRNAQAIRDQWREDWEKGGEGQRSIQQFLKDHCAVPA